MHVVGRRSTAIIIRACVMVATWALIHWAGMLITMSDMGVGGPLAGPGYGMHVYGPRGLSVLTTALGTFVNTREIGLQVLAVNSKCRHPCLRNQPQLIASTERGAWLIKISARVRSCMHCYVVMPARKRSHQPLRALHRAGLRARDNRSHAAWLLPAGARVWHGCERWRGWRSAAHRGRGCRHYHAGHAAALAARRCGSCSLGHSDVPQTNASHHCNRKRRIIVTASGAPCGRISGTSPPCGIVESPMHRWEQT